MNCVFKGFLKMQPMPRLRILPYVKSIWLTIWKPRI